MNQSQPVTLASPTIDTSGPNGTSPSGDTEAADLKKQVGEGNLSGLRAYLARTRTECEWHDRVYILSLVTSSIRLPVLDFACNTQPEAADLFLIRCSFFAELAKTMRGGGTCDEVGEGRFRNAAECVQASWDALLKAVQLDTQDPTAYASILPSLTIFGQTMPWQQHAFNRATELAPDLVPAYRSLVTSLSERWHGSHEKSLKIARDAMSKAGPDSDMAACLFWAHSLVRTHYSFFDKDKEASEAYVRKPEVRAELATAFDSWTQPPYAPKRYSIHELREAALWFYLAEDPVRLKRALELTGNVFSVHPWSSLGSARKVYSRAFEMATGYPPATPATPDDPFAMCLAALERSSEASLSGRTSEADKALGLALQVARMTPPEISSFLVPLVILNLSQLLLKLHRSAESQKTREQALAMLDANTHPLESSKIGRLIAQALNKSNEFRRALPFWEKTLDLAGDELDPISTAVLLHSIGLCYQQIDMRDFAAAQFRAALKVFRANPGDPRLMSVLINLGNALRKSSPADAENCYKEAADLYVSQLQLQSATPAWINLGILCSEQGRHEESLEYYNKALRVREQTRGTPPTRIASVLNNLANCYRRMGRFSDAHKAVDRAIKLFPEDDPTLASAFGTRGSIYFDSGEDAKAVEWFRKATVEHGKHPGRNVSGKIENLENEIAALKRMGKLKDAENAEKSLAQIRSASSDVAVVERDLSSPTTSGEGAVLIELPFGSSTAQREGRSSVSSLALRLLESVRGQGAGYNRGWIASQESTTLFFYGPDSEALFKALAPSLNEEAICEGARVVIRQNGTFREEFIARSFGTVN